MEQQRLSLLEETKQLVNVSRALLKRVYEEDDNQAEEFTLEKSIQVNIEPVVAETGVQYENSSRNVSSQTNTVTMVNHMTQTKKCTQKEKGILCVPQQIDKQVQVKQKKKSEKRNRMIQTEINTINIMIQTDETRPIIIAQSRDLSEKEESSEEEDNNKMGDNTILRASKKQDTQLYKAKKQTKKNHSLKARVQKSNNNKNKRSNVPDSIRQYYSSIEPEINEKKQLRSRRVGIASRLRSCDKKKRSSYNYDDDLLFS